MSRIAKVRCKRNRWCIKTIIKFGKKTKLFTSYYFFTIAIVRAVKSFVFSIRPLYFCFLSFQSNLPTENSIRPQENKQQLISNRFAVSLRMSVYKKNSMVIPLSIQDFMDNNVSISFLLVFFLFIILIPTISRILSFFSPCARPYTSV